MKHPGAHRRVGVDPLDGFKKDHYRSSSAAAAAAAAADTSGGAFEDERGAVGERGGARVKGGVPGQGERGGGGEVSKPRTSGGEVRAYRVLRKNAILWDNVYYIPVYI